MLSGEFGGLCLPVALSILPKLLTGLYLYDSDC